MRIIFASCLLLSACATAPDHAVQEAPLPPTANLAVPMPKGARVEPSGYLTIREVPPTDIPVEAPPRPKTLDSFARKTSLGSPEEQARAWEEANGDTAFHQELQRLRGVLERREAGNFVSVQLVRDPQVMGEFAFRRDGSATLAKYTADPAFRAVTVDTDPVALAELRALWKERMRERDAAIGLLGTDERDNSIEISTGLTEPDFRSIARRKGWDLADPRLEMTFAQPRGPAFVDPAIASLVRFFPRENEAASIRLTALGQGTVVLQDGCFRLADERNRPRGELVMFGRESQLGIDSEGYLAVSDAGGGERRYRIGEPGAWGGPNGVDEDSEDVRRLRKACGDDSIVNIAEPQSQRLFASPDPQWVLDYAYTKDITYQKAWERVRRCISAQFDRGRSALDARDRCIRQYNGWEYTGDELPPPPGQ